MKDSVIMAIIVMLAFIGAIIAVATLYTVFK